MTNNNKTDSNQTEIVRDQLGRFNGGKPTAGFNVNPQNISNGRWDKSNSMSYQYHRFMNMTVAEVEYWDKNTNKDVRTVAEDLAFKRVLEARFSLNDVKEITDRTEGKPKQMLETKMTGSVNVEDPQILKTLLATAQAVQNRRNETPDSDTTQPKQEK
jgi:hypothetical protein